MTQQNQEKKEVTEKATEKATEKILTFDEKVSKSKEIFADMMKAEVKGRAANKSEDTKYLESVKEQILELILPPKSYPILQVYKTINENGFYKAKYPTFRLICKKWIKEAEEAKKADNTPPK